MADKKVVIGGFAIGVAAGTAFLAVNHGTAQQPAKLTEAQATITASAASDKQIDGFTPIKDMEQQTPTFSSMADELAASQGGQISLRQMMALSEIYSNLHGGQPAYRDRQIGGIRLDESSIGSGGIPGAAFNYPYAGLRLGSAPAARSIGANSITGSSPSRRYSEAPRSVDSELAYSPPNIGAIDIRSGQFMAPAGPGAYVDPRNGTFYAPAGPNGVVNTRTGEFIPRQ